MPTLIAQRDEPGMKGIPLPRSRAVLALCVGVVSSGCGGRTSNSPPADGPADVMTCGDGKIDEGEVCDGDDLGGETCLSRGLGDGKLACSADCMSIDETGCGQCGDGSCAPGECETCPADCATCGDGCCVASEDAASCPEDCFVPGVVVGTRDTMTSRQLDVYSADLDGELAVKLSTMDYEYWAVSPDWTRVAYSSGAVNRRLYVVPAVGGDPVSVVDADSGRFIWAPDSSRIAFEAADWALGTVTLYTSLPSGEGAVPLAEVSAPPYIRFFTWAPDSSRIFHDGADGWLHVVRPDGTDDIPLWQFGVSSVSLLLGGVKLAPDGSRIAWVDASWTLHTVGTDGGGHEICGQGLTYVLWIRWAPDSSRIGYVADQDTSGVLEVYTCVPDGSGSVRVSGALVAGGSASPPTWAPDSSRIAYLADQETDDVTEVYSSLPDGTGNVKVSGPLVAGGSVVDANGLDPAWAPDSSRIAYVADQDTDEVFELYSSLPDGSGNIKVSGPLVAGGDVMHPHLVSGSWFRWAPDASRIAYVADQDTDDVHELYTSFPGGGGNNKISAPLAAGQTILSGVWSSHSSRIVYAPRTTAAGNYAYELIGAVPDGSGSVGIWTPPAGVGVDSFVVR